MILLGGWRGLCWIGWFIVHCIKSICIRSYSGPHIPHIFTHSDWIRTDTPYHSVFSPNTKCEKNSDQNNSEYGHFLSSVSQSFLTFWLGEELACLVILVYSTNKMHLSWCKVLCYDILKNPFQSKGQGGRSEIFCPLLLNWLCFHSECL